MLMYPTRSGGALHVNSYAEIGKNAFTFWILEKFLISEVKEPDIICAIYNTLKKQAYIHIVYTADVCCHFIFGQIGMHKCYLHSIPSCIKQLLCFFGLVSC